MTPIQEPIELCPHCTKLALIQSRQTDDRRFCTACGCLQPTS